MWSKKEKRKSDLSDSLVAVEAIFAKSEKLYAAVPQIRGLINSIWFISEHTLDPTILANVTSWVDEATASDFRTILWTNKKALLAHQVEQLSSRGIIVADHSLCSASPLYPYFLYFLEKGVEGDKAAFALASDILKIAILELFPLKEHYIYVDPSKVTLSALRICLGNLRSCMLTNSLGFFFQITPPAPDAGKPYINSNVLVALKYINPEFFNEYFKAYLVHLEKTYTHYSTLALYKHPIHKIITEPTSSDFFDIERHSRMVRATFGPYAELWPMVNVAYALAHREKPPKSALAHYGLFKLHAVPVLYKSPIERFPSASDSDPTSAHPYGPGAVIAWKGSK